MAKPQTRLDKHFKIVKVVDTVTENFTVVMFDEAEAPLGTEVVLKSEADEQISHWKNLYINEVDQQFAAENKELKEKLETAERANRNYKSLLGPISDSLEVGGYSGGDVGYIVGSISDIRKVRHKMDLASVANRRLEGLRTYIEKYKKEIKELKEKQEFKAFLDLLHESELWIEGALNCKTWHWDPDQHEAASLTLNAIKEMRDKHAHL